MNCVISKCKSYEYSEELETLETKVVDIKTLNELKDLILEGGGENYIHSMSLGCYDVDKYYFSLNIVVENV